MSCIILFFKEVVMDIFLYSKSSDLNEQLLLNTVKGSVISICRTADELKGKLNILTTDWRIVILLIRHKDEIYSVSKWYDLFHNLLTIEILQDEDTETMKAALKLRPRYYSIINHNFGDIASVVCRMQEKYGTINYDMRKTSLSQMKGL